MFIKTVYIVYKQPASDCSQLEPENDGMGLKRIALLTV
jgi:hypothetical protein